MRTYGRSILAGFVAPAVLSLLMELKALRGLMPALNLLAMLTGMTLRMMGMPALVVAVVLHLIRGALRCFTFGKLDADGYDDDTVMAF